MPDADYILYVTGTHYHCDFGTIAFAAACQLEDQYDRYILIITKYIYSVYTPCSAGLNEVLY